MITLGSFVLFTKANLSVYTLMDDDGLPDQCEPIPLALLSPSFFPRLQ